jgi:hypothetical protein
MRRGRRARSLLRTHTQEEEIVLLGYWTCRRLVCRNNPNSGVCECVKNADAYGKEAGVQSLQHTIRNPDLAEAARCAPVGLR